MGNGEWRMENGEWGVGSRTGRGMGTTGGGTIGRLLQDL
jgi:hypothetical protein